MHVEYMCDIFIQISGYLLHDRTNVRIPSPPTLSIIFQALSVCVIKNIFTYLLLLLNSSFLIPDVNINTGRLEGFSSTPTSCAHQRYILNGTVHSFRYIMIWFILILPSPEVHIFFTCVITKKPIQLKLNFWIIHDLLLETWNRHFGSGHKP